MGHARILGIDEVKPQSSHKKVDFGPFDMRLSARNVIEATFPDAVCFFVPEKDGYQNVDSYALICG